jgi:hypothetical protein
MRSQKSNSRRYSARPVTRRAPSSVASQAASPIVKAGKTMWKLIRNANWIRERSSAVRAAPLSAHGVFATAGGVHDSSSMDGAVSLGQYIRSMAMNGPFGAGSQLFCLALPGDAFWKYSVSEPSLL